jgi:hypothetical protein
VAFNYPRHARSVRLDAADSVEKLIPEARDVRIDFLVSVFDSGVAGFLVF